VKFHLPLTACLLFSLISCDSEQVQKIKDKVKQSTESSADAKGEETPEVVLFDKEGAIQYINSQLPKVILPGEYEFTAEKANNEKFGDYVKIQYLNELSYKEDYYNVDKSVSFMKVLQDKGWTNEFAQLKKAPYTFYSKVAVKGDKTAIQGSLIYRKSGEKMVFKDHKLERGHIVQGFPQAKFGKSYLLVGSMEADTAIDGFMQDYAVAKRHNDNVLNTVTPEKVYKGSLKITPELKKDITWTMGKQHKLLKTTEALITFDENPELKIILKGTYLTEIRPSNRSNVNYKVDSVTVYDSPRDPFFQKIHPYIKSEYFTLFLSPSGNLSGMSKNLKIDLTPYDGKVKE